MAILPLIELGSLWIGDVPVSPTRADFVDQDGDAVTINQFSGWEAYMLSPAGEVLGTLTGTDQGNHLLFTWPAESILETEGVHTIIITFTDEGGVNLQCEPYKFIVQELNGWLTLELARAQWADAPLDDVLLHQILQTAKEQCLDYAPALGEALLPPLAYVQAQLMQARAIYQSVIANQNDNVGIEGFAVRVFPLDFTIRAMLRPKRAIGSVY